MELNLESCKKVLHKSIERKPKRIELYKNALSTGILYLDNVLGGIVPNDLVVIGARTGAGKSELVTSIAMTNALKGKRVHHFALEAEEDEIMDRIIYKQVAQIYFNDPKYKNAYVKKHFNYIDWSAGKFDEELDGIEERILPELEEALDSYNVFYRSQDFGIIDLMRFILSLKDKTDLIIIDHLHYIDLDLDKQNENQAIAEVVKTIRNLSLISGKPIILVSHLRKADSRNRIALPDLEDFHGSSEISKMATKAIVLAPCPDKPADPRHFWTYMRVLKNRKDNGRNKFTARCTWDVSQNRYLPGYKLGKLSYDGNSFEELSEEEQPYWVN